MPADLGPTSACPQGVLRPSPAPQKCQYSYSSQIAPLPRIGLPGYSNNHHSPPLGSLDSFKPPGWISWPSPSGSPVSLWSRPGVNFPEQRSGGSGGGELGQGGHEMREGGVCLLAGPQSSSGPAPRPHVPGQAGFWCSVPWAGTDFFFNVLKLKTLCL